MRRKIYISLMLISSCVWTCDKSIPLWQPSKLCACKENAIAIATMINDSTAIKPVHSLHHQLKNKNFHERIDILKKNLKDETYTRIKKGSHIDHTRIYYFYTIDENTQQCSYPAIRELTLLEYCLYTHMNDAILQLMNHRAPIAESLHWAINGRNYKGATLLIKKYDAYVHNIDENGNTPLLTLCKQSMSNDTTENVSRLQLLRLLLQKGAYVNTLNYNGLYPLYVAASHLSYPMLSLLLENKKIQIQRKLHYRSINPDYFDPLVSAMTSDNKDTIAKRETIISLLCAGANPYYYIPNRKPFLAHMRDLCNNPDTIELYKTIKRPLKSRYHYGSRFFAYYVSQRTIIDKATGSEQENDLWLPKEIILQILNYAAPWDATTQKMIKRKYRTKREIKNMCADNISADVIQAKLLHISSGSIENDEDMPNATLLGNTFKEWIDRCIEKNLNRKYIKTINNLSHITCTIL